jgi:hypothetical protein
MKVLWVAVAFAGAIGALLIVENIFLVHMKPPSISQEVLHRTYDYYTLLTPPASGRLFHNEYNTTQLECWIRQLRNHGVAKRNIHVLSAGLNKTRNTRGEAVARKYGVHLVQRPLLVNDYTLEIQVSVFKAVDVQPERILGVSRHGPRVPSTPRNLRGGV